MQRAIVAADADLSRWLSWVAKPTGATRWTAKGEVWEWDGRTEEWITRRMVPEPHELIGPDGMPATAIDAEAIMAAEKLKPSQGDIDDAFKGCEPTLVETARGTTRVDYKGVNLRNADGTLNKYAKNMLDLNAPVAAKGAEVAAELSEKFAKVAVEAAQQAAG